MTGLLCKASFRPLSAPLWLLSCLGMALAHDAKPGAASSHRSPHKPAGVVSLDVYRNGALVHVLTGEAGTRGEMQLLYRQSKDGGQSWGAPVRVTADTASIHDMTRGNDAQLAADGQRLLAVWTTKGSGYAGSGPLKSAISSDGGKTWRPGGNPADDGSTAGHEFAELIAVNGAFHAVWLDGRDGAQGLRHAQSVDGLRWQKNLTVQSKTCECCWQSLLNHNGTLSALYRGRSPRDMMLSSLPNGGAAWKLAGVAGKFNWDFKACPHTGGALAAGADAKAMHALVWTGAQTAQGLHHLMSRDSGVTWNVLRRLGSTDARRGDIAVADNGNTLAAVWEQLESAQRVAYAAYSFDHGGNWSRPHRLSANDGDAAYPRVVSLSQGTGFLAAWTQTGKDHRTATIMRSQILRPALNGTRQE